MRRGKTKGEKPAAKDNGMNGVDKIPWTKSLAFKIAIPMFVFLIAIVLTSIWVALQIQQAERHLQEQIAETAELNGMTMLQLTIQAAVMPANDYLSTQDSALRDEFRQLAAEVGGRLASVEQSLSTEEGRTLYEEVTATWPEIQTLSQRILSLENPQEGDEGKRLMFEMDELASQLAASMEQYLSEHAGTTEQRLQDIGWEVRKIRFSQTLFLLPLTILGLILLVLYLRWRVVRPVYVLERQVARVEKFDLRSAEAAVHQEDEIGRLAGHFQRMAEQMRQILGSVSAVSHQVSETSSRLAAIMEENMQATEQVVQTINKVAAGAEQSASMTEDSAKAVDEMAQGVQRIAEISTIAYDASVDTEKAAERGREALRQVIAQMHAIHDMMQELNAIVSHLGERSQEIDKTVHIIAEIAAQTNLLALNASIEAARAGDSGRGFAVVANEIRKLAEQSRHSAEEIAQLIAQIQGQTGQTVAATKKVVENVESGVSVVHQAAEAFQEIVQAAKRVVEQAQEASAASEEMSASAQQIAAAIEQVTANSKSTAESVQLAATASEEQMAAIEEVTDSADKLSQMAQDMDELVGRFKL